MRTVSVPWEARLVRDSYMVFAQLWLGQHLVH
jgi:hypothetical protein